MSVIQAAQAARGALPAAYRKAVKKAGAKPSFTGRKPSFLLYAMIGMIALAKDALDLVMVGSLPAIGTVVTVCFNILIFLLFLFDHSGGRKKSTRTFTRAMVLILITAVEGIGFGLNFLPIETLTIGLLYILAMREYRKEKKQHDAEMKEKTKAMRLAESQERIMLEAQQAELAQSQLAEESARMEELELEADRGTRKRII